MVISIKERSYSGIGSYDSHLNLESELSALDTDFIKTLIRADLNYLNSVIMIELNKHQIKSALPYNSHINEKDPTSTENTFINQWDRLSHTINSLEPSLLSLPIKNNTPPSEELILATLSEARRLYQIGDLKSGMAHTCLVEAEFKINHLFSRRSDEKKLNLL